MIRLRVHGVPEHFNLPWLVAIDEGRFDDAGIEIEWTDVAGGTGALVESLASGEADMVSGLTEGLILAIADGLAARLVSLWTSTPLLWGVHVAGNSERTGLSDLGEARFAVSRLGSGSHLMALVSADDLGVALTDDQIVVVGDIDGARAALAEGQADYFLWERFMTAPLVATGEMRRVDVVPTPWPGFVMAATDEILAAEDTAVQRSVIIASDMASELHVDSSSPARIRRRYGLDEAVAAEWLSLTSWANPGPVPDDVLIDVVDRLLIAGVLPHPPAHDLLRA